MSSKRERSPSPPPKSIPKRSKLDSSSSSLLSSKDASAPVAPTPNAFSTIFDTGGGMRALNESNAACSNATLTDDKVNSDKAVKAASATGENRR